MEQALSRDLLVPLGLGVAAVVVIVVLIVVLVRAFARGSRRAAAASHASSEPTAADWTGEAVEADVRRDREGRVEHPPRRLTVADAVARRGADTAPFPVSSETLVARARAREDAVEDEGAPRSTADAAAPGDAPAAATQADRAAAEAGRAADGTTEASAAGARPGLSDPDPAAAPTPGDAVAPADERPGTALLAGLPGDHDSPGEPAVPGGAETAVSVPPAAPDAAPGEPPTPEPARATGAASERRGEPDGAGRSRMVAEAVQQALAARARLAQTGPDRRSRSEPPTATGRRGDARDRLLAVLLSDPELALGATAELDGHQADLARLNEAVRRRREDLADVVRRLADSGLAPEQVARLAELPPAEVVQMLQQARRP